MMRRLLAVLAVVVLPGVSLGQGAEKYLSPKSHFYFRWDGIDGHREAFDKTVLGQMFKGDTGKFVHGLWYYLNDQIEPLLAPVNPDVAVVAKEALAFVATVAKNGFAMSVEVRNFDPPEVEAVLVFPGNGGPKGKLNILVKQIMQLTHTDMRALKTIKADGMQMQQLSVPPLELAFGSDGPNFVLVAGNLDPASVMRRRNDKGNVSAHPLYKELKNFKEFHVWSQGFLDVAALAKAAAALSPAIARLTDDLGFKSLKSITFHGGFDGPASRSVIDFNLSGPRKGLLNLTKGHKFSLKDLPPLPHDIQGFSASSLDAPVMYDTFLQVAEGGVRVFSAEGADFVKEAVKQAELLFGVKIRDDLLGSLGNVMVSYNSPAESPFLGLGSVTLIKVKDEKKLLETLDAMHKNFPPLPFAELEVKPKKYRGVDVVEVQLGPSSFTTTTFALHQGWLVWSNYPQPVHGFILRTQGELPTWQMDARTKKALAPFPKEFTSFSMSDPAPGVQFMLSLAPPILSATNGAAKQFLPGVKAFDVSTVPHPLEATRHLFPNISISTDNGTRYRLESRSSFP